jgi:hypothetical protein
MRDHEIVPVNWTTVGAELQRNWNLPTGQALGRVFYDHYHSYGLLMGFACEPRILCWAARYTRNHQVGVRKD